MSSTTFCVVFAVLLYAINNALNADKLAKWFQQPDGLNVVTLSAYLLVGLCLFLAIFVLLAHRWTIKPLAIVFLVASAAATYFISKYGVAVDSSMIQNVIHTDATEVGQLLSVHMVPYVVFLALLPAILVAWTEITFRPKGRYLLDSLALFTIALLVAVGALYPNYNAIQRVGNVSKKYIVYSLVPINLIQGTGSVLHRSLQPLRAARREVEITGRVASPDNLMVVLAIGESSRRKNFSAYGYERRNTTPALQKTGGLHFLNGTAKAGITLYALREILEKDGVKLTAIASQLGIPTSCYVNFTLYDNCASPGETKVSHCRRGKCYDEDVVPLLQANLETYRSGYRFVVLHLGGGSHGPTYVDRYPPEFQEFQPICNDADIANQCTLEQLYNTYDASILYVDHVLGEIIRKLDDSSVPYVFIYLSDHGESLLEDGRMFHGMPPGVPLPPEQADIPLIVKSSVPISIVERTEYLQPDVFDTVLELLSIETDAFDRTGSFLKKHAARADAVASAANEGRTSGQ